MSPRLPSLSCGLLKRSRDTPFNDLLSVLTRCLRRQFYLILDGLQCLTHSTAMTYSTSVYFYAIVFIGMLKYTSYEDFSLRSIDLSDASYRQTKRSNVEGEDYDENAGGKEGSKKTRRENSLRILTRERERELTL